MKVLIFGSSGYIGTELKKQLAERDISYRTCKGGSGYPSMGLYSYDTLERLIMSDRPDVLINCAAYVGVNSISDCELKKDITINANVILPQMMANICWKNDITFGHFSSGCVYNGHPEKGWKEYEKPNLSFVENNCSFYTGTKVLSEQVTNLPRKRYVWRIRLPFDENNEPRNYLSKLLKYDSLVNAQNSISHKKELVSSVISSLVQKVPYGIYHLTNPGTISAEEVINLMKKYHGNCPALNKNFNYLTIGEYDKIAKVPTSNNFLNTDKLRDVGINMRPVHQAVEETIKEWKW
jgi:dTDP-4-dehydrorhamnose reductase